MKVAAKPQRSCTGRRRIERRATGLAVRCFVLGDDANPRGASPVASERAAGLLKRLFPCVENEKLLYGAQTLVGRVETASEVARFRSTRDRWPSREVAGSGDIIEPTGACGVTR